MTQIIVTQPPEETPSGLARFLNAIQNNINTALLRVGSYPPRGTVPDKPRNGDIYYLEPPAVTIPGFYGYVNGSWVYMSVQHSVVAAYGAISTIGQVAFPDLDGTYQKITQFNQADLTIPRLITQDIVNSELVMPYAGVYRFSFVISVEHNEESAGRQMFVRLHNDSSGANSNSLLFGTGSNTSVTNISGSLLLEILNGGDANDISLQIGGGDGYSTVQIQGGMTANMVSENRTS